jgi:carbamoyl-phosphate synthase small subunit
MKNAQLRLPNNTTVSGVGFGASGTFRGELVFTTAMTGYTEAMTDPSYQGQIVVFSYPLIGNYGVDIDWLESHSIQVAGIVINQLYRHPLQNKKLFQLSEWMTKQGVGGMETHDTRRLVNAITGEQTKGISSLFIPGNTTIYQKFITNIKEPSISICNPKGTPTIVVLDCGIKGSIIKELVHRGCKIVVVPKDTSIETITTYAPDGIVVSNGPYDPKDTMYEGVTKTIMNLIKKKLPMYGICLGHQLVALAIGADTYKLPFGHRGINHTVKDSSTGRAYVTAQNHGYGVIEESIPKDYLIRFTNLLDGTVEGISHKTKPIFTTQFHPEGHPGPSDTVFLFEEFIKKMTNTQISNNQQ